MSQALRKEKPQEIWDMITRLLPSLSARYASRTLQFQLEPSKEQHGNLWSLVFQDSAWITKVANVYHGAPTLLGASIEDFYNNDHLPPSLFSKTPFWFLLMGIPDLRFKAEEGLFWRCLQPYTYHEEAFEVKLVSGIVLNVSDVIGGDWQDRLIQPEKLFHCLCLGAGLVSFYVYWDGEPKAYTLDSTKIVGLGGAARNLKQIRHECQITIDGNGNQAGYTFYGKDAGYFVEKVRDDDWMVVIYKRIG